MPLTTLSLPLYPAVPIAPGVPPVLRQAGAAVAGALNQVGGALNQVAGVVNSVAGAISNTVGAISDTILNVQSLLTGDSPLASGGSQSPQWGIFDSSGNPVIVGDNVMAVDVKKEARVSDFPIENGGFASYDKVQTPFEVLVQFTSSDISDFLDALDAAWQSLNLYTVVTPQVSYANANLVRYGYKRDCHSGVTLIGADVWVREIRVAPDAQFTSSQGQQGSGTGTGPTTPTQTTPTGDDNSSGAAGISGNPPANVGTASQDNGGTVQGQAVPVSPDPGTVTPPGGIPISQSGSIPSGTVVSVFNAGSIPGGTGSVAPDCTASVDAANPRVGEPGYNAEAAKNAP